MNLGIFDSGVGGLTVLKEIIKNNKLVNIINGFRIELIINYDLSKQFEYLIRNMKIVDIKYDKEIKYIIDIKDIDLKKFENYNYKIISKIKIKNNS